MNMLGFEKDIGTKEFLYLSRLQICLDLCLHGPIHQVKSDLVK